MNRSALLLSLLCFAVVGCSGANDVGVGAECSNAAACENEELTCLTQFKGGYCGASGCEADADCPDGSRCVTQEGANYCFLECTDKADCNDNRSGDNEANCSSSITRVEDGNWKACIPPSGS